MAQRVWPTRADGGRPHSARMRRQAALLTRNSHRSSKDVFVVLPPNTNMAEPQGAAHAECPERAGGRGPPEWGWRRQQRLSKSNQWRSAKHVPGGATGRRADAVRVWGVGCGVGIREERAEQGLQASERDVAGWVHGNSTDQPESRAHGW